MMPLARRATARVIRLLGLVGFVFHGGHLLEPFPGLADGSADGVQQESPSWMVSGTPGAIDVFRGGHSSTLLLGMQSRHRPGRLDKGTRPSPGFWVSV